MSIYDSPIPEYQQRTSRTPGSIFEEGARSAGIGGAANAYGYADIGTGLLTGTGPFSKSKTHKTKPTLEQRLYGKGRSQLRAYDALLDPTLDLTARSAAGFGDIYRTEADKASTHDLNMFQALAPQYVQAIKDADPDQARLLGLLNSDASGLIEGGTNAYEDRELQQSLRGAQAARGRGYGNSDVLNEVLGLDRGRESRRIQRGAYGTSIANLNQRVVGDPFLAVTGRASQSTPQGSNPMSPGYNQVNQDSLSLVVNEDIMRQQREAADAANRTALLGAGIGAVGSLAGGAAGAFI